MEWLHGYNYKESNLEVHATFTQSLFPTNLHPIQEVKARQKTTERCPYVQEVFLIARQGISNG
jgi:hypothetical protein